MSFPLDPTPGRDAPVPAYHIGSVGRALTLLTAFSEHERLTVSDAAALLGTAPSTAHRLLQMLVHHGFVVQDERRGYIRGPAIRRMAAASEGTSQDIDLAAQPVLLALRDSLNATAHVISLEGNGGRFLTGAEPQRTDNEVAISRPGWLLPAHTLAAGRVLLAALPAAKVAALYPDGLPATRYSRLHSLAELQSKLGSVRERGFAVSRDAHEQVCAIGVAIPSQDRYPTMAVSVAWPAARFPISDTRSALYRLRAAARDLGHALG
jgi:DNA-binding IclR family transcriptional regulator